LQLSTPALHDALPIYNSTNEVPKAAALDGGRDLIRIYGCFGCHKIPGYEGVRKVGPDLSTISGKLTKEWVHKWLSNPKEFKSERSEEHTSELQSLTNL